MSRPASDVLDDMARGLQARRLVPLCGAGISRPAGLPGAEELVAAVLEESALPDEDRKRVAGWVPARLPFERLMEVVLQSYDARARRGFLRLFAGGKPCGEFPAAFEEYPAARKLIESVAGEASPYLALLERQEAVARRMKREAAEAPEGS